LPFEVRRSQDLFTYTEVSVLELELAERAYFEHTLLPYSTHRYTDRGYAVLMPRYLDYQNKRQPSFGRYFVVQDRIDSKENFIWFGDRPAENYWVDPTSPEIKGAYRGLAFLSFVGDQDETILVA
jgi:CRISPR-associated protein Cas5t